MTIPGVEIIDLGYLGQPGLAAAFLVDLGAPVLVECGPAVTYPTLERGLARLGLAPQDLAAVLLTHIHLDHAGAAGHLARLGVPSVVHPLGAKHLIEPDRLIASSRRVHGDRFDRDYGAPLPCPAELVRPIEDGGRLGFSRGEAIAIATPGHAKHHHAWLVEREGVRLLFAGDVAAMIAPGSLDLTPDSRGVLSLPTPPPDFDREAWLRSVATLRDVRADRLLLTHFGAVRDAAAHLDAVEDRLHREIDEALRLLDSVPEAERVEAYRRWLGDECRARGIDPTDLTSTAIGHFLGAVLARMNLAGVERWAAKRSPSC